VFASFSSASASAIPSIRRTRPINANRDYFTYRPKMFSREAKLLGVAWSSILKRRVTPRGLQRGLRNRCNFSRGKFLTRVHAIPDRPDKLCIFSSFCNCYRNYLTRLSGSYSFARRCCQLKPTRTFTLNSFVAQFRDAWTKLGSSLYDVGNWMSWYFLNTAPLKSNY